MSADKRTTLLKIYIKLHKIFFSLKTDLCSFKTLSGLSSSFVKEIVHWMTPFYIINNKNHSLCNCF